MSNLTFWLGISIIAIILVTWWLYNKTKKVNIEAQEHNDAVDAFNKSPIGKFVDTLNEGGANIEKPKKQQKMSFDIFKKIQTLILLALFLWLVLVLLD